MLSFFSSNCQDPLWREKMEKLPMFFLLNWPSERIITGNSANSMVEESWGSGGIRNSEDTAQGTSVIITNCTIYGNLSHRGAGSLEAGDIGNVSTNGAQIKIQNSILGRCYTDVTLASGSPGSMLSLGSNIFENEEGCNKTLEGGAPADLLTPPQLGLLSEDGTSLFRVSGINESGGLIRITVGETSANRSYTLFKSDDLGTSDSRGPVAGPLRGNGGALTVPDLDASAVRRFYRFGVTLP